MSANHTPEPWINDGARRVQGNTELHRYDIALLCPVPFHLVNSHEEVRLANARRIVAAVNACEGIPTKVLEDLRRELGDKPFGTTTIREICKDAVELINDPHAMSHIALEAMLRELEVLAGEDD